MKLSNPNPKTYLVVEDIFFDVAQEILCPPERLTLSEAATRYRKLNNPGSYVGPWKNAIVPYLVEPMDVLINREYGACIFSGPAQCGKTEMFLNWLLYSVVCDPADMLLIEKSATSARDFSRRRVDKLNRHSTAMKNRLIKRRDTDNTFDKFYTSGVMLTLSYPAINELSGRPVPRVALTDLDRMPEDIDGEGSPFDLARKRTTSYGSFAMTLAESSPGFAVTDTQVLKRSKHEAPPCPGILSLYNRGDRRRWYWPCFFCKRWFEPSFDLLVYPSTNDPVEAGKLTTLQCPHCKKLHSPAMKYELNERGRWLKEGQYVDETGVIQGKAISGDIASFWLKGPAAAFMKWETLVINYLKAYEEFQRTGSEQALKTTTNTDQGEPYVPRGQETQRTPEQIKERAYQFGALHGDKVVPEGVRFLTAMIDVQKNRWVVQVFGIGIGTDIWVIDRFSVVKSTRLDADLERYTVRPATYLEDWYLLKEQVMLKTYPLASNPNRHMRIKVTGCDSGGEAGVSNNAYDFYRKLKKDADGSVSRFTLIKGDPLPNAPRQIIKYPDSATTKGPRAGARGEIPVLFLNVNMLKDKLNGMFDCVEDHAGRIHLPDWLENEFYVELTVEQKTLKGWENLHKYRNEAWDLFTYCVGMCVHLRIEHVNWDDPQGWLKPQNENDLVFTVGPEPPSFVPKKQIVQDLKALAQQLA